MKIEFEIFLKGQKTRDQRKGPLTCNGLSAVQLTILIESYIILADEIHLCVHLSKLAINTCDEVMKSYFYESCRPWSFWSKSLLVTFTESYIYCKKNLPINTMLLVLWRTFVFYRNFDRMERCFHWLWKKLAPLQSFPWAFLKIP